ncbi:hypothetical protein NNC35_02180 [Enterococcus faecalis]|uniref:hypothetical protein n=1 Tax=Enterococcus faecalis TaxID=1351 RepID=UPI0024699ECE|nr:hypothetical protein [Enterococcus faecalis]MDH5126203.1 hypothetical protein [Enterococcus faecalis]
MVYRPRYLDKKRNKHFILSTKIKNNKLIVEYSNGECLVIDKKGYTFIDSNTRGTL